MTPIDVLILEDGTTLLAQENAKGILLEDGIPFADTLRRNYVNHMLGALVCWNMPTFHELDHADPDMNVDTFAPTGLDIDQWLTTIVSAGGKYATFTAKHHDGFALWPTAYAASGHLPYSVAQTAWYAANGNPDIVDLFVTKCLAHGLIPGLYFSIKDYTYEVRSGTTQYDHPTEYVAMIKTQLTELLTNYGTIESIWFDGWGWLMGYDYITYAMIYNFVKSLSPTTLVIENAQTHPTLTSEIETYEALDIIPVGNIRLSEAVQSCRINGRWFYEIHDDQSAAAYDLANTQWQIANANGNNGTYLISSSPNLAGVIPAAQVAFFATIP